jgi:hypothetical protein
MPGEFEGKGSKIRITLMRSKQDPYPHESYNLDPNPKVKSWIRIRIGTKEFLISRKYSNGKTDSPL